MIETDHYEYNSREDANLDPRSTETALFLARPNNSVLQQEYSNCDRVSYAYEYVRI